jgi:hypothetical protein
MPPRGFKHELELAGPEKLDWLAIAQPNIWVGREVEHRSGIAGLKRLTNGLQAGYNSAVAVELQLG